MKDRLGEISTLNQSSLNAVKHLKESINWDQNRKQRPFFLSRASSVRGEKHRRKVTFTQRERERSRTTQKHFLLLWNI